MCKTIIITYVHFQIYLLSSYSNKTSFSNTDRKTELFIEKNLNFSYSREYVNLKELTNGEISKNVKFMQKSTNYIKNLYVKLKNKRKKKMKKKINQVYIIILIKKY